MLKLLIIALCIAGIVYMFIEAVRNIPGAYMPKNGGKK